MATERQIAANQANAARSTGPRSPENLSRTRFNATKHGLASQLPDAEAARSPEFEARRARWAAEHNPVGETADWALDHAVAATFRIERCERTLDDLITATRERAMLAWDQDRAVEAATIAARLGRDPVLASRQLEMTLAGVRLLIEAWVGLTAPLMAGEDWSESEASKALDLLGVAPGLRTHRTPIDDPEGTDSIAFRHELALDELDRLEALRDRAMIPLDEMERRQAMAGGTALLSKSAKLVLRYERDAWKRYNDSMKLLKAQGPPPAVAPTIAEPPRLHQLAAILPAPLVIEAACPAAPTESGPTEEDIDAVLDELGIEDEDAWLDEMERRIEAMPDRRARTIPTAGGTRLLAPERTQFEEVAIA